MKIILYIPILLTSFLTSSLYAEEEIVFVYFNDFSPYSYSSNPQKNDAKGILPDYIKKLFLKINIKVTNESYPWEKAQLMVKTGDADGFITNPSEERKEYSYFTSKTSFIVKNFLIYTNKKLDTKLHKINNLDDLKKYRICDYTGNAWSQINLQGVSLIKVLRRADCVQKLKNHSVDFSTANVGFYKEMKEKNKRIKIFDIPFVKNASSNFHIGIRKNYPHSEELIENLEKAMEAENKDESKN